MAETTQVANQEPQTFSVALTEKLNSVAEALPKDFNKARFVQNALALVNDNPQLQKYSKAQLMSGLMKGAYLGLDFYSKECYLVPYGNQLNYQTDYRGAKKLAKKYSIRPIKDIYAKLVREGDDFAMLLSS
jgi:recombination protein RecT